MNEHEEIGWQNIFQNFLTRPNNIYKADIATLQDLMQASCMLLSDKISVPLMNQAITLLYEITFAEKITLDECWQIYWILASKIFTTPEASLLHGSLRRLYDNIFDTVNREIKVNTAYRDMKSRDQEHIIVITNQFLSEKHAPTRRILDYSYAIQKYMGKKVTIINSSELHYRKSRPLELGIVFNFLEGYSNHNAIDYYDEQFGFYQVDTLMPNLEVYEKLCEIIYELNPLLIYNIGGSNILADLCSQFTTTVSLPCSYDIPISRSKYLLVGRQLEDSDEARRKELDHYQSIIETEMNFVDSKDEISYTRSDFNLKNEDFVACIVGNRLEAEMGDDFLDFLKKAMSIDKLHIVFIGNIPNQQEVVKEFTAEDRLRVHFLGPQSNAKAIIKLSNLYINPKRTGGGRSSFEALSAGVPVITPAFGDVHYVCGKDYCVNNYKEMLSTMIKYYNDTAFYAEMKEKALQRAKQLSDITTVQKNMIERVLELESKTC